MTDWLKSQGIEIAELIREEVGVIPMEQVTKPEDGLQAIGGSSGAIRLSSGYGFSSIQSQMHELAMNLSEGNDQVPQSLPKDLIRMDKIFNNVLLIFGLPLTGLFVVTYFIRKFWYRKL